MYRKAPFIIAICLFSLNLLSAQDASLTSIIERYETPIAEEESDWNMLGEEVLQKERAKLNGILAELNEIKDEDIGPEDLINKQLLLLIIEDELYQIDFQSFQMPLNAEGGFLAEVLYNTRGALIQNDQDLERYLQKLNGIPAFFDRKIELMKAGQLAGKSSPKLIVDNCISIIDQLLNSPVENTFFLDPVSDLDHQVQVKETISTKIIPAYKDLRIYLAEEYLPNAPETVGISNITDGKAYYEQRVRYFTTFDISPEEVFEVGQQEVKRIRAEMESIIKELNFDGSFQDFFEFLRTDPQFYCTEGRDLLLEAAWLTTKAQGQLPRFFTKLPRMPLDVVPVPDAIAPTYTSGRYSPGVSKYQKPGQYLVNTYQLESRPLYTLPALTLHEGVPGHHLQIMLAAEIEDLPDFRRNTYISAFGEGWGLYAEHLGEEMGIYTDLYARFGRLTYEMWRACRLVVDPGMHYMGWTRQEAYDFMKDNTALSIHEINTEIDRYIGWPGQAVSYKMGELKIKELRAKAEQELGDQFDIRTFHDALLMNGSIPLQTLEQIIDDYILSSKEAKED